MRPGFVRLIFSRTRNRKLDEHSRDRRQDQHQQRTGTTAAIVAEKKYAIKLVPVAIISAHIIPLWPPKARPIAISSKVRAVSRNAVLKVFPIRVSYHYRCFAGLGDAWGEGPANLGTKWSSLLCV